MLNQLETVIQIGWILLLIFIALAITVISLSVGISAVKGSHTSFGQVFLTGLLAVFLSGIITFVFQWLLPGYAFVGTLVGLLISMLIIKSRHDTTFFGALGAILIYIIVLAIILVVIFVFAPALVAWISSAIGYDITQLIPSI